MSAPYLGVNGARHREDDEGYSRTSVPRSKLPVVRPAETKNLLIRAEAQAQPNRFAAQPAAFFQERK